MYKHFFLNLDFGLSSFWSVIVQERAAFLPDCQSLLFQQILHYGMIKSEGIASITDVSVVLHDDLPHMHCVDAGTEGGEAV